MEEFNSTTITILTEPPCGEGLVALISIHYSKSGRLVGDKWAPVTTVHNPASVVLNV